MDVIRAVDARKRFGDFNAVDGVSFAVAKGEFFGLLGPNGAGKTSTIRMLYGFSPITAGEMRVFGLDIRTDWRTIRSRIGVCQQDNTLDPDLSVEENLLVFAGYFLIPRREARRRTDELLDFFALAHKRKAKVSELSGGMARRLTLARCLINDPELVVLDEPTTGLDPQSRHQVWDKLQELRQRGLTILLTTHYMEEASRLCDRLVIMDHGQLLVEGAPEDLVRLHAGGSVVEVEEPSPELRGFIRERGVDHDDLGERIIIYEEEGGGVGEMVRERFCARSCLFRLATLEDVFLRLTGRGLRE